MDVEDCRAMCRRIDKEDQSIMTSQNLQNVGFEIPTRGLKIINESGLYSAILGSKKPTAKQFKHWVTSEVLPSLQKILAKFLQVIHPDFARIGIE